MVTGDMSPSGSKILDDHLKISSFVVTDEMATSPVGERWIVLLRVFQYHPIASTLTTLLGSATLCCDATSWMHVEFEDQGCRLKPTLFRIDRDSVK